jgi:hypothetical protein
MRKMLLEEGEEQGKIRMMRKGRRMPGRRLIGSFLRGPRLVMSLLAISLPFKCRIGIGAFMARHSREIA